MVYSRDTSNSLPRWDGPAQRDVTRQSLAHEVAALGKRLIDAAEIAQTPEDLPDEYDWESGALITPPAEAASLWDREHLLQLEKLMIAIRGAQEEFELRTRIIAEYAMREGMPQRSVAAALGLSTNTVNRWAKTPIADKYYV